MLVASLPPVFLHKKGAGGRTRACCGGVKLGDLAFNQIMVASAPA
jgi:hypothetical protein